ncbi:MAG: ADOP family duplicated permease [Gemmatimonadales bacterium]
MWNPLLRLQRRRRPEADFSAEVQAHLALETDRLVAEGLAPEEAAYEARRRFGNVGRAQEAFHHRRTIRWMEAIPQYLRRAARRLVRVPAFSATVALTLMLGIGATTAVFSLIDGVLLRPLPFAQPAELVDLSHTLVVQGVSQVDQSDATYLYYRDANHVFAGVGAYQATAVNLGATGPAQAARIPAARTSASLFEVLGVAPIKGRVFREDEDRPGGAPVVVLGERLWKAKYAADPGIIGRSIQIDGVPRAVIGIMPERFEFPDERTALWLPADIDPAKTESAAFDYRAVARLRKGVTPAAAAADLQKLLPHLPEAYPGRLTANAIELTHMRAVVRPLRDVMIGGVGRALWVVFGAAGCLLLIACANVANLFLVRAEERQHDLAVRRALGAGYGAIVAEFFSEGLLLAALGGVLGIALAAAGVGVLRSLEMGITIPRLDGVRLDGAALAVAAGVTVLAALVMSVVPVLRSANPRVSAVLGQTGRGTTAGRGRYRARQAFVVVQIALALVLIAGAGLMARSFQSLRAVPPGFNAAQAYAFRIALPSGAYFTTADAAGLIVRALDGIAALPGVQAAGVVSKLPLDDEARLDTAVFVEDRPVTMGSMPNVHQVVYATPGTFGALGVPLIQGRTFERPDPARAPLEVVVTHALARRYWGDGQVTGKRLQLAPDGPLFTIVGVTGDIRGTRLDQPPDETVFLPLVTAPGPAAPDGGAAGTRWMPRELAFVVRSAASPREVTQAVEGILRTLAPGVPVYDVRVMSEVVARSTARTSFVLELLEIASGAALLIGAVGLYGVVSYMVSLRAREMAVRIALGAQPRALRRLVLAQALTVTTLGIVLGLAAVVVVMRFLTALLFDVAPTDPVALFGAVALMSAVAMVASWVPARRAAAMDPAAILRADA